MDLENKWNIATRNTVEIMTDDELKDLLKSRDSFNFYFGIAPTGPFHLGYTIVIMKTIDLIKIGGKAKILVADFHAYLDDAKTPWEDMEIRSKYFEEIIKIVLKDYQSKVKIVRGSEFQATREYIEDTLRLSGMVNVNRAIRSASEVVRMKENPLVSALIYPIMQNVDVKHLNADVALGGIDQRHIYALGREILPRVGWKFIAIYTPLISSLKGPQVKMSASMPETHISVHDSKETIEKKIKSAYCPPKETEGNPMVELTKYVLLPYFEKFQITTKDKNELVYTDANALEQDYKEGKIHPLDLKLAIINYVEELVRPIREKFNEDKEFFEKVKASMKKSGYVIG